jgi:molybdate transport system permease protein
VRVTAFHTFVASSLGFAATVILALLAAQAGFLRPADFADAVASPDVRAAVVLSMICATLAAALGLLVAVPAAYALARYRFFGVTLIDALLDVPVLLSPVALGLALLLFFRAWPGRFIEAHLLRFVFEVPGIVVAQFILALALEVRVLKSAFEEIDQRLEQVARCLGCSPWEAFRRVTLPLVRPGLLAAFVLGWCRAVGDFGASVMIAGAVPRKTETIPIAIYLNLASVRLERAVALGLVLTAVAMTALVVVRLITRRPPA